MVFVTGGTGFLGTHLLLRLLQEGKPVRAIRRASSKQMEKKLIEQVDWVECDILDSEGLYQAMMGCDQIYHCAAIVKFLPQHREQMMKVNVQGTANIVNIALATGAKKLVYVSSVAAIGRNRNDELINENTEWEDGKNNSSYGISKHLAENEIWRGVAEGLNAVVVNPSLILGSGDWNDGPPNFFNRVRHGLRVYTNGGTGVVAVEDVISLMIILMNSKHSNEKFILNAENISFKELFFTIADLIKARRPYLNINKRMMEFFWRMDMIKYRLTSSPPLLTKETARFASNWSRFDNQKIINATGYQFTPIKKCLEGVALKFLQEEEQGKNITRP